MDEELSRGARTPNNEGRESKEKRTDDREKKVEREGRWGREGGERESSFVGLQKKLEQTNGE